MAVLGVEQPGQVQNPGVKPDLPVEQLAEPFAYRWADELSVVISGYEVNLQSGGDYRRQGADHGAVGCGDSVKLGDCLGVAAGEQAGTRTRYGNAEEIEGVAEKHQPAFPARTEPAEEVTKGLIVGEIVGESRAPRAGRKAGTEVEVADDDERKFAHRSIKRSRFSRT